MRHRHQFGLQSESNTQFRYLLKITGDNLLWKIRPWQRIGKTVANNTSIARAIFCYFFFLLFASKRIELGDIVPRAPNSTVRADRNPKMRPVQMSKRVRACVCLSVTPQTLLI